MQDVKIQITCRCENCNGKQCVLVARYGRELETDCLVCGGTGRVSREITMAELRDLLLGQYCCTVTGEPIP